MSDKKPGRQSRPTFTDQEALLFHSQGRPGKLEVIATKPCQTAEDLSLAYSPGVAEPCLAIKKNPDDAYLYTAKGNLIAVVGVVLLGAGAFLAIGFALASFLKTEEQATGVVQVVQMPMMFLSGIFFSFTFLPGFLQTIARLMPLTYLADAMRQVMVNGTQVAPLGLDIAVLAGWLVVCLGIAARTFRWE